MQLVLTKWVGLSSHPHFKYKATRTLLSLALPSWTPHVVISLVKCVVERKLQTIHKVDCKLDGVGESREIYGGIHPPLGIQLYLPKMTPGP